LVKDEQKSVIVTMKSEKERNEWLSSLYREMSATKLAYSLEKALMQETFKVLL